MKTPLPRVTTRHPEPGKRGVNIDARKYTCMRAALLRVVPTAAPGVAFAELVELVRPLLPATAFPPGSALPWYVVTVKLDLEARGLLRRASVRGGQRLVRTRRRA